MDGHLRPFGSCGGMRRKYGQLATKSSTKQLAMDKQKVSYNFKIESRDHTSMIEARSETVINSYLKSHGRREFV